MEHADTSSHWYAMLFPSAEEGRALVASMHALAVATGGAAAPAPHVTVGYFRGTAAPQVVVAWTRGLNDPAVRVHASGLFAWSEQPNPEFGYALSLRVRRDAALREWQRAVRAALEPAGLAPLFGWTAQRPHMHVLHHLPVPPAEALRRIADHRHPLTFTATRLLISQRVGAEYLTWLDQPLHAPSRGAPA